MRTIIAYDIADKKRLRECSALIKNFGQRVQLSIFEADIKYTTLVRLKNQLEKVIDPAEDTIRYFPLCTKCKAKIVIFGTGSLIEEPPEIMII